MAGGGEDCVFGACGSCSPVLSALLPIEIDVDDSPVVLYIARVEVSLCDSTVCCTRVALYEELSQWETLLPAVQAHFGTFRVSR